jgi:hypothetical protein
MIEVGKIRSDARWQRNDHGSSVQVFRLPSRYGSSISGIKSNIQACYTPGGIVRSLDNDPYFGTTRRSDEEGAQLEFQVVRNIVAPSIIMVSKIRALRFGGASSYRYLASSIKGGTSKIEVINPI